MACPFCDRANLASRTVAENERAFAFLTHIPIVPGHLLIAPKRHISVYELLDAEEREAIESLRAEMKRRLAKTYSAEGFNYAWNEGEGAGQSVPHLHLHVVPRKNGDAGVHGYEPRQFLYRPGSRAETPEAELAEVAASLREALA